MIPFLGLRTCIYFVGNMSEAVQWYSAILGKPPYFSEPYYAGFDVAGYELGLQPAGAEPRAGSSQEVYWGVNDIALEFKKLVELGAQVVHGPEDVGGNIRVARVRDPWGNVIGIIYNPHFMVNPPEPETKPRVDGIGGVFLTSKDPDRLKAWYEKHLGIPAGKYGATFEWRSARYPDRKGFTAWSVMPESTPYFLPGNQAYMINYRVPDLTGLLDYLKNKGVEIIGAPDKTEYGTFAWIMDPDGNKIELWEAVDEVYATMEQNTIK